MYVADGSSSPQYLAGDDVIASMGQDAFAHRSKLASTPIRPGAPSQVTNTLDAFFLYKNQFLGGMATLG
jgi:hypothetical protein